MRPVYRRSFMFHAQSIELGGLYVSDDDRQVMVVISGRLSLWSMGPLYNDVGINIFESRAERSRFRSYANRQLSHDFYAKLGELAYGTPAYSVKYTSNYLAPIIYDHYRGVATILRDCASVTQATIFTAIAPHITCTTGSLSRPLVRHYPVELPYTYYHDLGNLLCLTS